MKVDKKDTPLLELLAEWLEVGDLDSCSATFSKSFSVPYMYQPRVAYDEATGKILYELDGEGNTNSVQH